MNPHKRYVLNGLDEAFPLPKEFECGGLTKREYFALHLMAGYVAGDGAYSGAQSEHLTTPKEAAKKAVQLADALIEALNNDSV